MILQEIINTIEQYAPPSLQENYDNSGLLIGQPSTEINGILISLDITEEVIQEAIDKKANLIISHHPIIFSGLKQLTGKNYIERCVIKSIQHNICIYCAHTNLDAVKNGVNGKICEKLELQNTKTLSPAKDVLNKLVTFIPTDYLEKVRTAIFEAGAGHIGQYDSCSFNVDGKGTFKAGNNTSPFAGKKGSLHEENEIRFETIFPDYLQQTVLNALLNSHPYEEVAYDIYPIKNIFTQIGSGMIGELKEEMAEKKFLDLIKKTFKVPCIRHTALMGKKIKKVAVCGGSGSFLLNKAIQQKADIFISADFKYHQFFDAENKIIIADIGHFESEQFTSEIFYDVLTKKLTNFAIHFSEVNTNPLNYY